MPAASRTATLVRVLALTLCAVLTGGVTASSAAAAVGPPAPVPTPAVTPVPTPAVPAGLPVGIEELAGYVPANSCDPRARTGTTRLGALLVATYPGTSFGTTRSCGTDPLPTSEHYDGRALDWMVSGRDPARAAQAQAVLSWLLATDAAGNAFANARRLGVMYVIWNNKIWGAYRTGDGWRPYSSCASRPDIASDTTCHRDHVHLSLSWPGATGRTSFWTRLVAATDFGPCRDADLNWAAPYSLANPLGCPSFPRVAPAAGSTALTQSLTNFSGMWLATGSTGPAVKAVQQALHLGADGVFGVTTRTAVVAFQKAHQLAGTGSVNADTWRSLLRSTTTVPVNLVPPPDVVTPAVKPPVATPKPKPKVGPLTRYRSTVLRQGSRGKAVKALQKALRVSPRTGFFGPRTRKAVKRFQRAHRLPATGVVARATWRALGA